MFYFKTLFNLSRYTAYLIAAGLTLGAIISAPVKADIHQRIAEAEALRIKGHLPNALAILQTVKSATTIKSQDHTLVMGLIANIYVQQRMSDEAWIILSETQPYAEQQGWQLIAGDQSMMLANLYIQKDNLPKARQAFEKTHSLAHQSGDKKTAIQASLSLARLNLKLSGIVENAQLMDIQQQIKNNQSLLTPALRLNWVKLLLDTDNKDFRKASFRHLETILKDKKSNDFDLSQAYGLMAQLYTNVNRDEEALTLLNNAIFAAQAYPELLFKWEWHLGNTLQSLNQTSDAIAALRRAVTHVEAIRQDIPVDYVDGRSSFRATLEPLYLQLTDLLLQHARTSTHAAQKQPLLVDARATIELLKRSELEDYFDNRCVIEHQQEMTLSSVTQNSAAIYPIMLPDRLEILVSLGDHIEQRTVAVPAAQIAQNAQHLASAFRSLAPEYQDLSRQFYQWLIAPIQPILQQHQIDTLIYLPDGALRLVPIASLYNGRQFLIEQYAVVTSPGLTLLDSTPTARDDLSILLAGLSSPGPVVDDVSDRLYAAIDVASNSQLQSNLQNRMAFPRKRRDDDVQLIPATEDTLDNIKRRLRITSKRPITQQLSRSMMSLSAEQLRLKNTRPERLEQIALASTKLKQQLRIVAKTPVDEATSSISSRLPLRIKARYTDTASFELARLKHNNPLRIVDKTPVVALTQNTMETSNEIPGSVFRLKNSEVSSPLRIKKRSLPDDAVLRKHLKNQRISRLKQRLQLPGVTTEIENIAALYESKVLLNDGFAKQDFINTMLSERVDIVHIASHGVFGDSAQNSFVMTHDEILDMDQLEQLLSHQKFAKAPIDLITLSACQTADGDDRAPLGISGIALRAKVRSALGALWAVSDAATVELMSKFYVNLSKPGISKAEALRQAQISMLKEAQYQHPFFWSAFILIGNWM